MKIEGISDGRPKPLITGSCTLDLQYGGRGHRSMTRF